MSERNLGPQDPNHPLHRASYALETIKWGAAWQEQTLPVTPETREIANRWLARVLEACGLDLDAEELQHALDHYVLSYEKQTGAPPLFVRSILLDGFVHGLALKAGLDADPPDYYGG